MKSSPVYRSLPVAFFILLLAGLLWSRSLLSIAEGLALAYGIVTFNKQTNNLFKEAVIWSICPLLLFWLGAYQTNRIQWNDFDYLLTLAAYPAAVFFMISLNAKQQQQVLYLWTGAVFLSLLYPLGWYTLHIKEALLRIKMGQSLPAFMNGDHVRYSLFVCSGFLILFQYKLFSKKLQIILTVLLAGIIVFLSVRTAWVALAIILLVNVIGKIKWYYFATIIVLCAVTGLAVYKLVPTVQQKINYTIYDWEMYNTKIYSADFSDGARRTINDVAWQAVIKNHQSNIGWSNVPPVLQEQFHRQYPFSVMKYGWPFNQFLFWWMGAGFTGILLFTVWLLYPVFIFYKTGNRALLSWTLVITASCMVESSLNMQYGVLLHGWMMGLFFVQNKTGIPISKASL